MFKRFFAATLMLAVLMHTAGGVAAAGVNGRVAYQIEKSVQTSYIVDEKPAVDVQITIPQGTEDTFAIKLITDYAAVETVRLEQKEKQELHLEFAVQDEGYHHLCAQLLRNGAVYHEYAFEQYYVRSVRNDGYMDRGFNVHFQKGVDFTADGNLLKAGGTPVLRVGLSWNGVEKEKGKYDFSQGDEMVAMLGQYGFEAVCIIDSYHFGHALYPDENGNPMMRTPEQINAFADFAVATVKRYPQIHKWEIFNEPNFLMTGEEYFNVVYTVAKRIKEYDPESEVYAGGLAIYDTGNFVNGFYIDKLYPYVDGISYHHYNHWRYADGPEYYATTDEIVQKMMQEGGWKKLIMTESGYSTGVYNMEVPEIKQASENVKRAVLCDWYGIDFMTLYDFKNDGYDPAEVEHNFGSVTHDYEPKPGYYTMKQYMDAAGRTVYIGEAYLAEDITAHVYAANDDYFMIAWAKNNNDEADIRNDQESYAEYSFAENVHIEDMFGNPVGGTVLQATYQPSYIHGLGKEFCLQAIRNNRAHDLFGNLRTIMQTLGFSTEEPERLYAKMCESADVQDAERFAQSCYALSGRITDAFLGGTLDIGERVYSNALSELYQTCERALRAAVLFDDVCSASGNVYERYASVHPIPEDAVEQRVVYLNEPYYKGKQLLKQISVYDAGARVMPVKGSGFELRSDDVMLFSGVSAAEEVFVKIDAADGSTVYMNLIPTDGAGNYYFELTPDMPYGEYTVTVNNGTVHADSFTYCAAEAYLSIEDKMTALALLQAEQLLALYEKNLAWAELKGAYLQPDIDAFHWDETKWVNITGKIERAGWAPYSDVILTAYDKTTNALSYIDSTYIDENGAFRFSFKYDGDPEELDIKINQGGVDVGSDVQAIAENKVITGTVTVTEYTDTAAIAIQLQNYFKAERMLQPVLAYYDSSNTLISCTLLETEPIENDESVKNYNIELPEGTAVLKVFAWDSIGHMMPYAESAAVNRG